MKRNLGRFILLIILTSIVGIHSVFALREVVISEIAWMGTPGNSNSEWIELQNTTGADIPLVGWTLVAQDGAPSIALTGTITANGFFLLERTNDNTVKPTVADKIYTGALGDAGEILILKNALGEEIDRTPVGGWIAGESATKKTMERSDSTVDGTKFSNWHTYSGNGGPETDAAGTLLQGTPRRQNSVAPLPMIFPDDIELVISEASPDRDAPQPKVDFVELLVKSSTLLHPNLKGLVVKHNGTELVRLTQDLSVSVGDRVVVNLNGNPVSVTSSTNPIQISTDAKDGLSAGSGTVEVILAAGTPQEKEEDFICWRDGDLSATEQTRVDAHTPTDWTGDCVDIASLVKNESIARVEGAGDTNTKADFFRHYLGSLGLPNTTPNPANHAPVAKIKVQGTARVHETSLNFTGQDSEDPINTTTDADGDSDIFSWQWQIAGTSCGNYAIDGWEWRQTRIGGRPCNEESSRANPDIVYFDFNRFETFDVLLTVTDLSGAVSSVLEKMTRDPFNVGGGTSSAFEGAVKNWLEKQLAKSPKQKEEEREAIRNRYNFADGFFDDFLAKVGFEKLQEISKRENKKSPLKDLEKRRKELAQKRIFLHARDRFTPEQRRRIAKNIGLIFLLD